MLNIKLQYSKKANSSGGKEKTLNNSSTSEQQEGRSANQEKPSTNKMYSHKINKLNFSVAYKKKIGKY